MFAAEEAAAAEVAYFESRAEELRVEMQAGCARPWTRAEVAVEMAAAPAAVGAGIIAIRCLIPLSSERASLLAATQQALAQAAAHTTAAARSCFGPRDRGAGSWSTIACRRLRGWTA